MWQDVVCTGCAIRCRYRDLRGTGLSFQEVYEARLQASRQAAEAGDYSVRVTRSNLLGQLHEAKVKVWKHVIMTCDRREVTEGDGYEVASREAIVRPYHPVIGNARQRQFLQVIPHVFTMREARETLGGLSKGGVLKFVNRLIQRGLAVRLDVGRYAVQLRTPVHVCQHFDAALTDVQALRYTLRCRTCGQTREIGDEPTPF